MSDDARSGLLLHLSGPLQSWGERSMFNERDTARFPTRSGLIGMIAAALGYARDKPLDELRKLRFAVRTDRPGSVLRDFHTVGGGQPGKLTVKTAEGKPRPGDSGTLVSQRYYLQDAAFTVAVMAAPNADPGLLERCYDALLAPCWPPYLGRRSCPPAGPLLLGHRADVWQALGAAPLHAHARQLPAVGTGETVRVTFRSDVPLDDLPLPPGCTREGAQATSSITDDPVSFTSLDRQYLARRIYQVSMLMPISRCKGIGIDYLDALKDFLQTASSQEDRP